MAERFKERRHILDEHLKERHPEVFIPHTILMKTKSAHLFIMEVSSEQDKCRQINS